jgi:predicted  nucleic acid-binding Zn-ribbon protein
MSDIESKIKKAYELSDLLYSRERDKISSDLEKVLPKISEEFNLRGMFHSSIHVNKILDRRLEALKQLVNFRMKQDMQEISKLFDVVTSEICEKIYERVKQLIESQIDNLKFEMEKFCRHFPGPDSYLDLIDSRIKDEKNKLIGYAKREVDIFQRQSESIMKRDEKKEKKFIVSEIIEKIDSINLLMKGSYKIKLFEIQEQKIWNNLLEPCQDKKDFVLHITALSSLIDWINIKGLKGFSKIESLNGSINYLETFLQEKYPYYDLNVIKRLRRIKKIRKMFPVHRDTNESIKAIEELGESYPNANYKRLWDKILLDFYTSLRQLEEILLS